MTSPEEKIAVLKSYLLFCFERDDWKECMRTLADIQEIAIEVRMKNQWSKPTETISHYLSAQKPKKKSVWHRLKKLFFYRFSVFK